MTEAEKKKVSSPCIVCVDCFDRWRDSSPEHDPWCCNCGTSFEKKEVKEDE